MNSSKYNTVPKEIEASSQSRIEIGKCAAIVSELLSDFRTDKLARASLSATLLWEYMVKMDWRLNAIEKTAQKFSESSNNEDPKLRHWQLQYVDRVESFHRQIYGTLSVLILFLSHSAPRKVASEIPIRSVQKFIKYLKGQNFLKNSSQLFDQLLDSVNYRAYFLDHPQQSKLYHWLTMGLPQETVIVHYVPLYSDSAEKEKERYPDKVQHINPRLPNFWPFVTCSSYRVSPNSLETFNALYSAIRNVLIWCKKIKDET